MYKEEATGFGFSADGGQSFTDQGGLPNDDCANTRYYGDPSVEAYVVGGVTYFYISSIYIPFTVPENALSVTACRVLGSGPTANLECGQPTIAAISSDCQTFYGYGGFPFCSFLDKEFLAIDPARRQDGLLDLSQFHHVLALLDIVLLLDLRPPSANSTTDRPGS